VWALPTPGGPDDFAQLVDGIASGARSRSSSYAPRTLFAIRWKVGELLGWDRPEGGLGSRVPTVRDRLPADLRDAPSGPDFARFTPLYLLHDEFAAEVANQTMHGVMHLSWVPHESGGYRGQMAVRTPPTRRDRDRIWLAHRAIRTSTPALATPERTLSNVTAARYAGSSERSG